LLIGMHALLYSKKAEAVRAFFRDTLGFPSVDAGEGWLIFALPPAELGIHPTEEEDAGPQLNLMCDDIEATIAELRRKGVEITQPVSDHGYGLVTAIRLPDGQELDLYEPRHPTALSLSGSQAAQRGSRDA
jgi:catechol 2,3-dioxygenase-like lactoylglutathione lyase family enzyme